MANPHVRPHLSFYPEDANQHLSEARHGARWLRDMPSSQTTPMIRVNKTDDYYIYEPAMLKDNMFVIPHRWFAKHGEFYALAWKLIPTTTSHGAHGWQVQQDIELKIPASQLFKNFPSLCSIHERYGVPIGPVPLPQPRSSDTTTLRASFVENISRTMNLTEVQSAHLMGFYEVCSITTS